MYCSTMPSSFDGKYGSTRYWLRAEMNRFGRSKQDKTKRTISFVNPLNIGLAEYEVSVSWTVSVRLRRSDCVGWTVSVELRQSNCIKCSTQSYHISSASV